MDAGGHEIDRWLQQTYGGIPACPSGSGIRVPPGERYSKTLSLVNYVDAHIHRFMQAWSGWTAARTGAIVMPLVSYERSAEEVATEAEWERAEKCHQTLKETALNRLFGADTPTVVDRLLFVDVFRLGNTFIETADPARVKALLNDTGGTGKHLAQAVTQAVLRLRLERGGRSGEAQLRPCQVCGGPIASWQPTHQVITALRGHQVPVCGNCLFEMIPFNNDRVRAERRRVASSPAELIETIRALYELTSVVPLADPVNFLASVPAEHVSEATVLCCRIPPIDVRRTWFPHGWSDLLVASGLLALENSTTFGLHCVALDGHACRSLGEKLIDDWFHRHGLQHEPEPAYPFDAEFNPAGMRADFRVKDTWIEYFGLMNRPDNATKVAAKRELVGRHGIHLVELFTGDLTEAGLRAKLGHLLNTKTEDDA